MLWCYFDFTDNEIIYLLQTYSTDGVNFFAIPCAIDNVDATCCPRFAQTIQVNLGKGNLFMRYFNSSLLQKKSLVVFVYSLKRKSQI